MRALATALLVLLASATPVRANPLDFFGDGARATALGGANTAGAVDGSANYYNPALLARLEHMTIELGYHFAQPELEIDGGNLGVDSLRGTRVALGMPGRIGDLRIGVGVHTRIPDQHIMRVRSLNQEQPRFVLYDNLAQRLAMSVNFGVAFGDRLTLGAGMGYFAQTAGSLTLDGRLGFPMAADSDLQIAMDMNVTRMVYPQLGAAFQVRSWLRLALSYRGGLKPKVDQTVNIMGDVGAAGRDPIVEGASVALRSITLMHFQPQQITAGASAQLTPRLLGAFDVSWHRWSRFGTPAAKLETELDLREFNDLFDPPADQVLAPPNFHDVVLLHVGAEYLLNPRGTNRYLGRAGYRFEPSPAPEQIGITNYVDNDKHTVSLGLGARLDSWSSLFKHPLVLDAALASTFLPERSHHKLSPVDPIGDYRAGGWVWQMVLTSKMEF